MQILWHSSLHRMEGCLIRCFNITIHLLGPLFILLALALISLVAYTFFTVNVPYMFPEGGIGMWANGLWGLYLVICIFFHYGMSICLDAGVVKEGMTIVEINEDGAGSGAGLEMVRGEENASQPDASTDTLSLTINDTASLLPVSSARSGDRPAVVRTRRRCKKCLLGKPDRAHHCSVCQRCITKMDHHCPWIHNCVGNNNHRYFYLFLAYMALGCTYYSLATLPMFTTQILTTSTYAWPSETAKSIFILSFLLAAAIDIAMLGMWGWHTMLIARGETTIEYYINQDRRDVARTVGEYFVNEYDLGTRRNFAIFFNLHDRSWLSVFVPWPVPPATNGVGYITVEQYMRGRNWGA
ncbi:DHHC palmitoyltransferase-domain-containing protein [Phlyctochytrium arcticum]|nr:DHHC palmitoyltransferase-domain-containing protein [Phlyctochytrium arcticum]